jgi:hypothetical protein
MSEAPVNQGAMGRGVVGFLSFPKLCEPGIFARFGYHEARGIAETSAVRNTKDWT